MATVVLKKDGQNVSTSTKLTIGGSYTLSVTITHGSSDVNYKYPYAFFVNPIAKVRLSNSPATMYAGSENLVSVYVPNVSEINSIKRYMLNKLQCGRGR